MKYLRIKMAIIAIILASAAHYMVQFAEELNKIPDYYKQFHSCPSDMKQVGEVCIDIEKANIDGKMINNQSFNTCETFCADQDKRLLTNDEWLEACEGTPKDECDIHSSHPVLDRIKDTKDWFFNGVNCKIGNPFGNCMKDETLATGHLEIDKNPRCISKAGIHNMVGPLGEWVKEGFFNGGLMAQPKSSCYYSTRSHNKQYYDYSIGCRCAKDLY